MKIFLTVLQVLLVMLLVLLLFFWLIAHASGHNIPTKTDLTAAFSIGLTVMLFLVLGLLKKRLAKRLFRK